MTENQKYYLTENFSCFGDIKFACKDNGTYLTVDGTIGVLNALVTQYHSLEKKNEELKDALSEMNAMYEEALASDCETERNSLLLDDVKQLKKENEQLKQSMDKLFDYFAKWFEEERGIYIEDFCILWKDIQKGDVE